MQKASKDDLEVGRSTKLVVPQPVARCEISHCVIDKVAHVSGMIMIRAVGRSLAHSACRSLVLEQKIYDKINNLTGKQRKPKKAAIDKDARTRQRQRQQQQQLSWARLNFMTVARLPHPLFTHTKDKLPIKQKLFVKCSEAREKDTHAISLKRYKFKRII